MAIDFFVLVNVVAGIETKTTVFYFLKLDHFSLSYSIPKLIIKVKSFHPHTACVFRDSKPPFTSLSLSLSPSLSLSLCVCVRVCCFYPLFGLILFDGQPSPDYLTRIFPC